MKEMFLESGKSILIFGNLGTILLFLKDFIVTNASVDLLGGILFFIGSYFVGNSLIYINSLLQE